MDNLKNDSNTNKKGSLENSAKKALAECFGKSDLGPLVLLTCKNDKAWQDKLKKAGIDYAYIDAWSMSYGALKGIRDRTCERYEPEWLKKLKQCGILVLNNFDAVREKGTLGETWGSAFGMYSMERPILGRIIIFYYVTKWQIKKLVIFLMMQ